MADKLVWCIEGFKTFPSELGALPLEEGGGAKHSPPGQYITYN